MEQKRSRGRPKKFTGQQQQITLYLDRNTVESLDRIVEKRKSNRTDIMREAIQEYISKYSEDMS